MRCTSRTVIKSLLKLRPSTRAGHLSRPQYNYVRTASVESCPQRANGTFENDHEFLGNFDEPQGPAHVPPKVVVIRPAMNCCC